MSYRGGLIALAGTMAWAWTGIFISYLLKHYPIQPLTLAFWRALIVSLALLLALRLLRPSALVIARRDWLFLVLYGLIGLAVFNSLWTYSVQFNGASVATVLAYSSPAFTALLARALLREPLTARKWAAVAFSLSGCVLVAEAYRAEAWRLNFLGIVVGLASGLTFAFYSLAGRWSARRFASAWTVTTYGFLFAALALALTQTPALAFSLGRAWDGWLILLILALGPTIAGFGLYTLSLRYLPASVAALIASLEPAMTALIAIQVLGERLKPLQWAGAGLILIAVILAREEAR